jgi:hypothetical protein
MTIGSEIEQMLSDLQAETYLPELEEGDLTNAKIAQAQNVIIKVASNHAEKMIRAGKWKRIYKRDKSGHKVAVYTIAQ